MAAGEASSWSEAYRLTQLLWYIISHTYSLLCEQRLHHDRRQLQIVPTKDVNPGFLSYEMSALTTIPPAVTTCHNTTLKLRWMLVITHLQNLQ